MVRKYTKVEWLAGFVKEQHDQGKTYGEIAASKGLEKKQVKKLMERQRRKERLVAAGYVIRPKGRPRKDAADEAVRRDNEIVQLKMTVELLRNFLSEAGRR